MEEPKEPSEKYLLPNFSAQPSARNLVTRPGGVAVPILAVKSFLLQDFLKCALSGFSIISSWLLLNPLPFWEGFYFRCLFVFKTILLARLDPIAWPQGEPVQNLLSLWSCGRRGVGGLSHRV